MTCHHNFKLTINSLLIVALVASIAAYSHLQPIQTTEYFDVRPTQEHISYLYCPGLMATEMVMGRYCPQFTAVTGEKFTFKAGGHILGAPHSAVIFPEIDLRKPGYFTLNPITAYLNRIRADLYPLLSRIFQDKYQFDVQDNPKSDLSVMNYSFNFGQANAGQQKDIKALHAAYHTHLDMFEDTGIVAFGDSRGATALFNFIAHYKPKHIKAAILESIEDDIPHQIKHLFYTDKNKATEDRLMAIHSLMAGSYKKDGPSARKYAESITDDIPLLFVCSLKDGIVNPQCILYLYNRLTERGFKNIHILLLENSSHPCYMLDNEQDKRNYELVVHAFYEHYGLPHNKFKAYLGRELFAKTQPEIGSLEQMHNLEQCPLCWCKTK